MAGSVRRFGLLAGMVLGLGRLLRCHPGHDGGIDEVPQTLKWLERWGQRRPEVASES
jgi:putative component of membrane protein insertase Oxa1/YidC/SpoIIIJ protein YidD